MKQSAWQKVWEMGCSAQVAPFTEASRWVWIGDEHEYNAFREAEQSFHYAPEHGDAQPILRITAYAYYQAWINGLCVAHGPSKTAEGILAVDTIALEREVRPGLNQLRLLVLNPGAGTTVRAPGLPCLRFEILSGANLLAVSGRETRMRLDPQRLVPGARRWMLPCQENVHFDAVQGSPPWCEAEIVQRAVELRHRRVPLPTRERFGPKRVERADGVEFPSMSVSFRHRAVLVPREELSRMGPSTQPAYLVTEIVSPVDQPLEILPAMGHFVWYFVGGQSWVSDGWNLWDPSQQTETVLPLQAGANRLVGVHRTDDRFDAAHLVGRCRVPVEFVNPFGPGGFQIFLPTDPNREAPERPCAVDWNGPEWRLVPMTADLTLNGHNLQDVITWATPFPLPEAESLPLLAAAATGPWLLPAAPQGRASRLILDLGEVRYGWLHLVAEATDLSELRISLFEAIEAEPPYRINWSFQTSNALAFTFGQGTWDVESFHAYGGRYLAIHHTGSSPLVLHSVELISASCSRANQGFFECSDPELNSIYEMCVRTIIASTDDTYTDCPTYEQANWNFDNRVTFGVDRLTTGNLDIALNSFALFAEAPLKEGLLLSQYPATWNPVIPHHTIQWLLWFCDFSELQETSKAVAPYWTRVVASLENLLSCCGPEGLLSLPGAWNFIEWGAGRDDRHAVNTANQSALIGALSRLAVLAEKKGLTDEAERWARERERLIAGARALLWDAEAGAFVDSLHEDGAPSSVCSQVTNAMCGLFGLTTDEEARSLARRIAQGDPRLLEFGSPYGLYYLFHFLENHGHVEEIFALIRRHWGGMLRAGDLTAWEHFPHGTGGAPYGFPTRSRCHPFSSFIIEQILRHLVGLPSAPLQDGVLPAGVLWARGQVPTPEGGFLRSGRGQFDDRREVWSQ